MLRTVVVVVVVVGQEETDLEPHDVVHWPTSKSARLALQQSRSWIQTLALRTATLKGVGRGSEEKESDVEKARELED